jgi:hypothetical protein
VSNIDPRAATLDRYLKSLFTTDTDLNRYSLLATLNILQCYGLVYHRTRMVLWVFLRVRGTIAYSMPNAQCTTAG